MMSNSDHFAIAIGIGDYPGIGGLASASADAAAFVKWLGAEDGGGVPAQNVQALLSRDATAPDPSMARARQHEIWRALEYLGLRSGQHIGQRLYLFVRGLAAGHGHDLLVLTAEAKLDRLSGFSLRAVVDWLQQGGVFDEIIVL